MPTITAAIVLAVTLLVPAAGAHASTAARTYPVTARDAVNGAEELMAQRGSPSVSIALVDGDGIAFTRQTGFADRETSTAPTPSTRYGIASVSKMFAAVAVMQLVDRGLVRLDAPLVTYLPSFRMASPGYRDITVRMLLDHTSGLPGTEYRDAEGSVLVSGYPDLMLTALASQRLKYTPGLYSSYSNDGFTLCELLVEAVSGREYAVYVTDEILVPLGMKDTAFPTTPLPAGTWAKCYTSGRANRQEVVSALGAGGVYSTPTDMGRLASMFMNGGTFAGRRILSRTSVAEMGRDQVSGLYDPAPSSGTVFGLGWDTVSDGGFRMLNMTGWTKGGDAADYHSAFCLLPRQGLACVVTLVSPGSSHVAEALAQRVLLHALQERGTIRKVPRPLPAPVMPLADATPEGLVAIAGYWSGSGSMYKTTVSASRTRSVRLWSWNTASASWDPVGVPVRLRTDGAYGADGQQTSIRTVTGAGRRYLVLNMPAGYGHYRDDQYIFEKAAPAAPLSTAWATRAAETWLQVDELATSDTWSVLGTPVMRLSEPLGLTGFLLAEPPGYGRRLLDTHYGDGQARMFQQIPHFGAVDQEDLLAFDHDGQGWLRYGDLAYRPASQVPSVSSGATATIDIGDEGYVEWRSIGGAGDLHVAGARAWRLYDADYALIDQGDSSPGTSELSAPGCRLAVFGPPRGHAEIRIGDD